MLELPVWPSDGLIGIWSTAPPLSSSSALRRSTHPAHQRDSPAAPAALSDLTNPETRFCWTDNETGVNQTPILRVAASLGEFILNYDLIMSIRETQWVWNTKLMRTFYMIFYIIAYSCRDWVCLQKVEWACSDFSVHIEILSVQCNSVIVGILYHIYIYKYILKYSCGICITFLQVFLVFLWCLYCILWGYNLKKDY